MGDIKNNLKKVTMSVNVGIGRIMTGDLSMFDKGDRRAFTAGSVIGAVLFPCLAFAEGEGTDTLSDKIGNAFNTMWEYGLKIAWALAAVMALVAIIWTIAAGSKEVSKPLTWLRRIVLAVIGINFILTVISWAKDINANTDNPSSLFNSDSAPSGGGTSN